MGRTALISPRSITLTAQAPSVQSGRIAVPALASEIVVRIQRPTTAAPLNWDSNGTMRVTLGLVVDGQEFTCVGQVTGGVRTHAGGQDLSEYSLSYKLPVLKRNGVAVRIGEGALSERTAYVLLERLRGSIETSVSVADVVDEPAPDWSLSGSSV